MSAVIEPGIKPAPPPGMRRAMPWALAGLAAAQLALGLALQFAVLVVLGAGSATDAYVAALTLPMLAVAVLALPLHNLWLPRLAVLAADRAAWRRAQGLAQGQLLALVGGAAVLVAASASGWVPLLFPGLTPLQAELTVQLSRILLLGAVCQAQAGLSTAALRSGERFMAAESVTVLVSAAALAALLLVLPRYGVIGAAWVGVGRSAAVAFILHSMAGRPGVALLDGIKDATLWRPARALIAGSAVFKCEPLVDRFWASQAAAGGLTVLNLAQTGIGAVAQILERAVCMPLVPGLARMAEAHDFAGMQRLCRRCLLRVSACTAFVGLLLLLSQPLWEVLMQGLFKLAPADARQMWWVCLALVGFLHVSAAGGVPVAAFYAMGDTRTPVLLSLAAFLVGVGLKAAGFLLVGLPGLALATSVYCVGNYAVVSWVLRRRLNDAAKRAG